MSDCERAIPSLVLQSASLVEVKPLRFLVPGVFPLGKLVLLAGKGGLGKSSITIDLAARLSRGQCAMGMQYANPMQGDTVFASCEDDESDTIVPRLLAAGADLSRVHFLRGVASGKPDEQPALWSLAHHESLKNTLKANRNIRLLVIDPANAFAGRAGIDGHNDAELRALLGPLTAVAAENDLAALMVTHLRKSESVAAADRVMGSAGWINAVRAAWMVVSVPPSKSRLLLPIKSNLFSDAPGFEYATVPLSRDEADMALSGSRIDAAARDTLAGQLFRIEWRGSATIDADEALALAAKQQKKNDGNGGSDADKAAEWLADFLSLGPVESGQCVSEGNRSLGVRREPKWWRALLRDRLGGKPRKHGFGDSGKWYFALPDSVWPPTKEGDEPPIGDSLPSLPSLANSRGFAKEDKDDESGILCENDALGATPLTTIEGAVCSAPIKTEKEKKHLPKEGKGAKEAKEGKGAKEAKGGESAFFGERAPDEPSAGGYEEWALDNNPFLPDADSQTTTPARCEGFSVTCQCSECRLERRVGENEGWLMPPPRSVEDDRFNPDENQWA
jgi:putative DNA primase/helicase